VLLFVLLFTIWEKGKGKRTLLAASLTLGLCLGTHLPNLLIVPVFAVLVWRAARDLRLVSKSLLCVAAGAAQYVYLILRVMQSPLYVHPQARFFDSLAWTGSANPLYNWMWFITGARWRGHYVGSGVDALRKLGEFESAVFENFTVFGVVMLVAGAVFYILTKRQKSKAVLPVALVILQSVYFVVYEWSSPGMILPFFALASVLIAVGVNSLSQLLGRVPARAFLRRLLPYAFAGSAAVWLIFSGVSRPAIDISHLAAPSAWIREMITSLPEGAKVDGLTWDYAKVLDYYRLVDKHVIPFQAAACDARSIEGGTCFVLGVPQAMEKYRRAGYVLQPAVYVEEIPVAFRVSPPGRDR
jgi:hypothetical protein